MLQITIKIGAVVAIFFVSSVTINGTDLVGALGQVYRAGPKDGHQVEFEFSVNRQDC